ncbi:Nucleoid-associated protein YgaU, contains BON and LysM domains [Deinococcus reticulitermitis]|uniref:Nucleoid-associated protein YgaU, contains BON and LysM domains n=2 Tax=Deinococcus reticulitermitis TaxID=856736 RepID=A0A1H6XCQ9_9DEIO|nr:Nucleoid-associated protein YgaU, contains BON and LysM domains [Deinococcus reticulitermitis]
MNTDAIYAGGMWPFGKSTADRVKEAIAAQPRLKDAGIQVSEQRGTVKLVGMVPTAAHVALARAIAEGISGVRSVEVSGLIAQQSTTPVKASAPQPAPGAPASAQAPSAEAPAARIQDIPATPVQMPDIVQQGAGDVEFDAEVEDHSRIAKAVHQAIRGNAELKDDPIDVLQSGKSVILRGVVDSDHEKRLAEKLAREVDGVSGVDAAGLRVAQGVKELVKDKDEDTGDTVYTVKAGDSLSAIAQKYYGDPMEYKKIAHYNNISNPDLIHPGQKIRIPG